MAQAAAAVFAGDGRSEAQSQPDAGMDLRRDEESSIEGRVRDIAARQARLERRDAVLAALAAEAAALPSNTRSTADALGAIESLAPSNSGKRLEPEAENSAVRAYAPTGASLAPKTSPAHRLDSSWAEPAFAPTLAEAALSADLDAKTRLDLVVRSLDRLDSGAGAALAAIDRRAAPVVARDGAILDRTGLDPERFVHRKPPANTGGPLVPLDADPKAPAFEQAVARVGRDISWAESLNEAIRFAPLRKPLAGDAAVTSPFGYRADPFLGRPALHTGVDLLEPYGSPIRATGAGHVTHAGYEGGYGDMVEIDHGFGLSTRYGHLSQIAVSEGQAVAEGDVLGRLGSTGRSTGPHLHYEVRVDGEPVDPERFIHAGAELSAAE